tara:strand:- start:2091 stop:3122 length:1032 start_codon:yes stop_codon:yes gene_type:complete
MATPLIALRSPQFKYINIPLISTALSAKCVITIDGQERYSLTKNSERNNTVNFDISELARDYLNITYDVNYVPQTIDITTTLSLWDGLNGTGTQQGSDVVFTDTGIEAYGEFEQGTNPTLPSTAYLISNNPTTTNDSVDIYYPKSITGAIAYTGLVPYTTISGGGDVSITVQSFAQGSTAIGGPYPSTISRIDCTKYGNGRKIIFINKFGVQQDLWFFLKETKTLGRKNEGFKSNTITYPNTNNPATYSISDAPNKVFNTTARQTFTLSSGYYPEQANQFFEQLLLSEYIWFERPQKTDPTSDEVIPVKVKTSTIKFKTSVNDRLIEYTIDFEEAFDYINNIR